jgi:hypothetical protein
MPLSPEAQSLIEKLEAVHERAAHGDREAVHFIKSIKTRALSGDAKSLRVYNTLAVLHWRKQRGGDYDKAEAYYLRLKGRDPKAMAKLQTLLQRVRSGDTEALTLFRVLKSIHGKFKSSAFTDGPGAPKIGGYGLPQEHRPGIIIGSAPPLFPAPGVPMTQPYNYPRFGGFVVGADPEPLTPQAVANLIGLMVKVRGLPLGASAANLLSSLVAILPGGALPGGAQFAPGGGPSAVRSMTTSLVQQAAEPAICAAARSAIARMSPAAPGLVAQCRAQGFNIPFDATAWQGSQAPEGAVKALGRVVISKPIIKTLGSVGPAMTDAQRTAMLANQGMCNQAASAKARNSPAAPGLAKQCAAVRILSSRLSGSRKSQRSFRWMTWLHQRRMYI